MKQKLHALLIVLISAVAHAGTPHTILPIGTTNAQNHSNQFQLEGNEDANVQNVSTTIHMGLVAPTDVIQRLRFKFSVEDGSSRPLLLAFVPNNAATDGVDYGYDALNFDQFPNDMFWNIQGANYVIQGVGTFDSSKSYPLNVHITNPGNIKIGLTSLENFDTAVDVFVYDSLLNTSTQINTLDYEIFLDSGSYINRFHIAFASNNTLLSIEENATLLHFQLSYLKGSRELLIKSEMVKDIEKVYLINTLGQSVMACNKQDFYTNGSKSLKIPVHTLTSGIYIIRVESDGSVMSKRALISN